MKKLALFLVLISSTLYSQNNVFEYKDSDHEDNTKIMQTIDYINREMQSFNYKVDKHYCIKTLLDKISFYERMSDEILKENNYETKKGLMKSIIISEEETIKRSGAKIFDENESPEDFIQIMKGSLRAMRRLTLRSILEEYNHFLKIKLADK